LGSPTDWLLGISMDLQPYLSKQRRLIDEALEQYLPPEDRYPEVIYRAMRYSVLNGGKRIRPVLMLAACEAVGGDQQKILPAACAIEFIHSFSLIHDDLPALDNDDFRRGKPTSHKVFGEAIAILAGDALLTLAFETLTKTEVSPELLVKATARIASAAGIGGMIAGQVADIISEGRKVEPETLEFIHRNKTGALIQASVYCGGLLVGGTQHQLPALDLYGKKIGLAFQIADDILDVGEEGKATYPSLYGLEKSKELGKQAVDEAIAALSDFDSRADPLRALARFIIERKG
jgi:geranylgeranyl diphosphate synthase type II